MGVALVEAVAELEAVDADADVSGLAVASADFGVVSALTSTTKPNTTATTARTAEMACLSRTGSTFPDAPRRRAEVPTVDQSREGRQGRRPPGVTSP